MNTFEEATRKAYRYETHRGWVSTEDLWNLPLTSRSQNSPNLNDIAKALHAEVVGLDTAPDFVDDKKNADPNRARARLEVVKRVIEVIKAERDAALALKHAKEQKQLLMRIREEKNEEGLKGKTVTELDAMIAAL